MGKFRKKIVLFLMVVALVITNGRTVYSDGIEYTERLLTKMAKENFYNLTTNQGLSNNNITDIYQDSMGYMWIGTKDGLNKYNGNMVREYNYERNNENSLSSPWIKSINEDANGNMWVGTNGGLNIIRRSENKVIRLNSREEDEFSLTSNIITTIYRDSNDVMWVGTENGLNRYDEKNNKFIKYYSDGTDKSISNNYITDMEEDTLGYLWISTIDGVTGIDINTYETYSQKVINSNIKYVYALDKDKNGEIWCVTDKGLLRNRVGNYELLNYYIENVESINNDINEILCDSNNNIWLGTSSGLIKYTQGNDVTQLYSVEKNSYNYLLSNVITCLYEDRNGVIWIGTDNGISILNTKQQFSNRINDILDSNGIYQSSVTTFLVDCDNDLWVGTAENGLIFFDVSEEKMIRFEYSDNNENSLFSNNIKDIEEGKDGKVIVATSKGMNVINKKTGKVYGSDEEAKRTLFFDHGVQMLNGGENIWLATMEGLYRSNNETIDAVNLNDNFIENGIYNNKIYDIFQDETDENILWIAGGRDVGLIKFHKEEGVIKNYLLDLECDSLSYNAINCIIGDGQENIWIGTEAGLYRFNIEEETFIVYSENDGLRSDYINSIIIDNNKDIWLGTTNGLSKFIIDENRFINFTEIDGICGSQFSKNAAYKAKEGHLLFGTTNGVVSFNPDNIEEIASKYDEVIIGDIWVNRELYKDEDNHIDLDYHENTITIEYFIPDYSKIGGISYLYKMDGVNDEWIQGNSDGYVVFNMMKPGNYTFRVKALKSDGSVTEEKVITFNIQKPFWQSGIAYFIYTLCIVLVGLFSWKHVQILKVLINKQTKEINNKMEENKILYERTIRNEKFKNDYFVNLSHELRTPLNIILSVLQLLNSLEKEGKASEEKSKHYMNVIVRLVARQR